MRVSSIRWGVIFIGIGLLFLAINLELLDSLVFPRLFALWPILLIAIGVEILFRHTRLYFLAFLSPILIACAFIVAATATGDWGWKADEIWSRWDWRVSEKKVDVAEIPADSLVRILDLNLDCGSSDATIKPVSDKLFKATADYYRRSPWTEHSITDSTEKIQYFNREKGRLSWFGIKSATSHSEFEIADFIPLKTTITASSDAPIYDFSGLKLTDLNLDIHSSRATVRVGDLLDSMTVVISGKTTELNLVFSKNLGLSISGNSPRLQVLLQNSGFSSRTDGYFSENYNDSARKARIILNADIQSLEINRY